MRSILPLAVVLLVLAAALRLSVAYGPVARGERGPERGTSLLVTSRGGLLPDAPIVGADDHVAGAILVGDLLLSRPEDGSGLRVIRLGRDLELLEFETFPLATEPGRAAELDALAESADIGSVLVLAVQGFVRPESGGTRQLDDLLGRLGARVSPFRERCASWALVTCRDAAGWRSLGESYSTTRSVSLTTTILKAPELRTRGATGEFWYVEAEGEQRLDLVDALPLGVSEDVFYFDRWANRGGVTHPSVRLRAGRSGPSTAPIRGHVQWDGIALGTDPSFEVQLAVAGQSAAGFEELECQLWIDGRQVATLPLASQATWTPWKVDLADYEGRVVRLELCVVSPRAAEESSVRVDWILWGEPALLWTAGR